MVPYGRHPRGAVAEVAHLPARVRKQLLRGCEVRLAVAALVDDEPRVVEQLALAVPEVVPELTVAARRLLVDGSFPAAPGVEAGEIGAHAQTHAERLARVRRHRAALHLSLIHIFLRLALELALRGVRVVPVFQRRLLRQHDANPYGSAHGDNGHQRGEYMLGHAEDLAGILGGVGSYVGNGMRSV